MFRFDVRIASQPLPLNPLYKLESASLAMSRETIKTVSELHILWVEEGTHQHLP